MVLLLVKYNVVAMTSEMAAFLQRTPGQEESTALRALWHAAHGDWTAAHEQAEAGDDADSAWVHALLHREEGDASNARYWYRRAGKPFFSGTIQQERDDMIAALLQR